MFITKVETKFSQCVQSIVALTRILRSYFMTS